MSSRVRINGEWFDKLDAKLGVLDHGLLYGDGATVGIRIEAGKARHAEQHVERLLEACDAIDIKRPMSIEQLLQEIDETIRASERTTGYVKLIVTRGAGSMSADPRKCEPTVIIVADDCVPYPPAVAEAGVHLATATGVRRTTALEHRGLLLANTLAVTAMREALAAGCLDAVILNPDGHVTGVVDGELFVVNSGAIRGVPTATSPDPLAALELRSRFNIAEAELTLKDLADAEEVFLVCTAAGVVPVVKLDGKLIGNGFAGPVTIAVRQAHRELVSV